MEAACEFGTLEGEIGARNENGLYIDVDHPLTCNGSIVEWHFCFYTNNFMTDTYMYQAQFRVYRRMTGKMKRIHDTDVNLSYNISAVNGSSFVCLVKVLEDGEFFDVLAGDFLAAFLPFTSYSLRIVGVGGPGLNLASTTKLPPASIYSSEAVSYNNLVLVQGNLHLLAKVGKCTLQYQS